jgi:hypothetical protein
MLLFALFTFASFFHTFFAAQLSKTGKQIGIFPSFYCDLLRF